MENQAKRINQSLDDFVKGAIDAAADAKKEAAAECFKRVVKKSPVWGGGYISSHNIGIGVIDKSIDHGPNENIPEAMLIDPETGFGIQLSIAQKVELRASMSAKANSVIGQQVNIEVPIYVSNSMYHANRVEYIGWNKTGPYHVYGLTAEEMKTRLSQILKLKVSQNADLKK